MEQLKADVGAFELTLKDSQADLVKKKERMEAAEPGSDERRTLEIELTRKNADLRAEMEVKRADFLAKEATIYATRYRDMEKVVRSVAAKHEVRLVLRFSGQDFNDRDRTSVLQAVNRPVVFQDELDITDEVIAAVNADVL